MCKVKDINECEKMVVVNDGYKNYSSEWFSDIDPIKCENKTNCTLEEDAKITELCRENSFSKDNIAAWFILRKKDDDTVYISDHAFLRLKERNGWNKKCSLRMVKKVCDDGTPADEIKGYLSGWLRKQKNKGGNRYIVYGNSLFIFDGKVLMTAITLPCKEAAKEYYRYA